MFVLILMWMSFLTSSQTGELPQSISHILPTSKDGCYPAVLSFLWDMKLKINAQEFPQGFNFFGCYQQSIWHFAAILGESSSAHSQDANEE